MTFKYFDECFFAEKEAKSTLEFKKTFLAFKYQGLSLDYD
jgi:hypothetical protein